MASMPLQLPDDLYLQPDELAGATGRTKTCLIVEALRNLVDYEAWKIAGIEKGIAEADAGDFATDEELRELDAKWGNHAD